MANGWNFPSNNYGTLTGIGEAGIETFKGSPYRSLAREICQNSMDARNKFNEPVIVEFSSFTIDSCKIPDYVKLKNAVSSCLEFWTEQDNKKTVDFFTKAKKVIEKNTMPILRISDYNTTGLQGSDKEFNTPWQNLVKSAGVSDKCGSAGGSFGIGKSAPFACSDIRTLFYATKDIDGLSASQGIAKLVSFREKDNFNDSDSVTTGTGYYGSDKKNSALKECISLDPLFTRTDVGTDVFVLGFNKSDDWKNEIIISVLEDFLIAVYNNDLIVRIDDVEISLQTLYDVIEKYKETPKTTFYNYYQVLTDDKTSVIEHKFPDLGTVRLYILINQGLHRKVMMCRKNGMKIFDQKNISSTIQFAGICVLKDESINAYFREMENPQHDAWEPERHTSSSKTAAAKNKRMLSKYIKDSVIELGRSTTVDEADAEGVGEFLSDLEYSDTSNQNNDETISDATKNDIEINISKVHNTQKGFKKTYNGYIEEFADLNADQSEERFGGSGAKEFYDDSHNNINEGNNFGNGDGDGFGTNGEGENPFPAGKKNPDNDSCYKSVYNINLMSIRLFLTDKQSNTYTLILTPEKNADSGYLEIKLSGEQSNVKVPVLQANDLIRNTSLRCENNKIYLNQIEQNKKNKIFFCIDYAEESSLEVILHGYSS